MAKNTYALTHISKKMQSIDHTQPIGVDIVAVRTRKKYTLFNFLLDIILVCLTGGLWVIWIFAREMRNR